MSLPLSLLTDSLVHKYRPQVQSPSLLPDTLSKSLTLSQSHLSIKIIVTPLNLPPVSVFHSLKLHSRSHALIFFSFYFLVLNFKCCYWLIWLFIQFGFRGKLNGSGGFLLCLEEIVSEKRRSETVAVN